MEFGRRLNQVLEEEGFPTRGRAAVLRKITGVSNTGAQKWLAGVNIPRRESLRSIADEFHRSIEWLEYGVLNVGELPVSYVEDGDSTIVEYCDVIVGAGSGRTNADPGKFDRIPFKKSYLDSLGVKPQHCCVIYASGDSMHPTIQDGDAMLVHRGSKKFIDKKIYVFRVGNDERVKRISMNMDGSVVLISDNDAPVYPNERIDKKDLETLDIFGQVLWTGGSR